MALKDQITTWLQGCGRLAIMGIGNPLRGDDAIGLEVIKRLKGRVPGKVKLLNCETVPENYLGEIELFGPTHVLMIDAARLGVEPGEARIIPPERISATALSTHAMSLFILAEIIQRDLNAKVMLLGIQPQSTVFVEKLSSRLEEASEKIAETIAEVALRIT